MGMTIIHSIFNNYRNSYQKWKWQHIVLIKRFIIVGNLEEETYDTIINVGKPHN